MTNIDTKPYEKLSHIEDERAAVDELLADKRAGKLSNPDKLVLNDMLRELGARSVATEHQVHSADPQETVTTLRAEADQLHAADPSKMSEQEKADWYAQVEDRKQRAIAAGDQVRQQAQAVATAADSDRQARVSAGDHNMR